MRVQMPRKKRGNLYIKHADKIDGASKTVRQNKNDQNMKMMPKNLQKHHRPSAIKTNYSQIDNNISTSYLLPSFSYTLENIHSNFPPMLSVYASQCIYRQNMCCTQNKNHLFPYIFPGIENSWH